MKNIRFKTLIYAAFLTAIIGGGLSFTSCVNDTFNPQNLFSTTDLLVGQYLSSRPNDLSEFTKLLDTTKILGLMDAYGKYTCFIPCDSAMRNYYHSKGKTSMRDFTMEELKKICYNHIIKGDTIPTGNFAVGQLGTLSMSERYIKIDFSLTDGSIMVNGDCPIIEKDIRVHNGYIHLLGKTLEPSELKIAEKIALDPKFSLFYEAMKLTGYEEFINNTPLEDETYDPTNCPWKPITNVVREEIPQKRKLGFTVLMESDSTLANYMDCPGLSNGVKTMDDLKILAKYYYTNSSSVNPNESAYAVHSGVDSEDWTNPGNYLNRFIAYHCMNRMLGSNRFINDYDGPNMFKTYDMYEFIETMLSNTLIKVRKKRYVTPSSTFFLNMWNEEDVSTGVKFAKNIDNDALNGFYHEIDKPLVYSKNVVSNIASNRIRMDAASFFPEFASNNMRGNNPSEGRYTAHRYIIPKGFCEGLTFTPTTRITYLNQTEIYEDWQGDEIFVEQSYNLTMVTPPIPAGTYEVRMGYQPTDYRGIAQLYWDNVPCGIPLNLSLLANNPEVGWVEPGKGPVDAYGNQTDPYGFENDKMMHNRGYLKGPCSYNCYRNIYNYTAKNARFSNYSLRRILGTYTFNKAQKHTFSVIGLGSTTSRVEFMLDYLEFVPTELLEKEGIE